MSWTRLFSNPTPPRIGQAHARVRDAVREYRRLELELRAQERDLVRMRDYMVEAQRQWEQGGKDNREHARLLHKYQLQLVRDIERRLGAQGKKLGQARAALAKAQEA